MSTYTPISAVTLSANTTTVTFSGIPQTYTDLVLVAQAKSDITGSSYNNYRIQFNGDTTSLYSDTFLTGSGTSATSTRDSNQTVIYAGILPQTSASAEVSIFHFMNYSNTTTNKTVLCRGNMGGTSGGVNATVGLWRSTAAITRIDVLIPTQNFLTGSTFTLYGIGAGSPKAFGGDEVLNDGTYWYHVYRSSGVFSPMQSISADVLVVAGGGGGGGNTGAGGGAGGLLAFTSQSLTSGTNNTVTVGAGGAGIANTTANGNRATNGGDSQFGSLTLVKGGGGGGSYSANTTNGYGADGGSGGGGGTAESPNTNAGGNPTSGQGSAGGTGFANTASVYASGGGGGAGGVGGNGASLNGGDGGVGSSTYSSWGAATNTGQNVSGTYFYAGGGGGASWSTTSTGPGGSGGGGAGSFNRTNNGTAGTANTGGGGGGGAESGTSFAGGSGIVIVRYAV
jgi:hypothetical protein